MIGSDWCIRPGGGGGGVGVLPILIDSDDQSTQNNTCQIVLPRRILELKVSNLKTSFHHPRHLKSRVPPGASGTSLMVSGFQSSALLFSQWSTKVTIMRITKNKP